MRKLLLIFGLCLALPAQASDLLRYFETAYRNDAVLEAARHARDVALEREPQARAVLLPQVAGSYDYSRTKGDVTVGYALPPLNIPQTQQRDIDGDDRRLAVNLKQSLFDLASWRRLQQAGQQTALAQAGFSAAEQALALRVAEAYFGVLSAQDALRSSRGEAEALSSQLAVAQQNLEVGLSSQIDVQDVQARYDLALASQLDAEQAVSAAEDTLQAMTRNPLRAVYDGGARVVSAQPTSYSQLSLAGLREDASLPPLTDDADGWAGFADTNNFDVVSALLGLNIAERGVQAARARFLPSVSATAGYSDFESQSGSFPTSGSGTSVGVGITVPLFAGGATVSAVREAAALRDQRLAEYDNARREAERAIRSAYKSAATGTARINALKRARSSTESALEATQTGLEIGTRNATEVLDAQQRRYTADRNYRRARYDYVLAVLRLEAAAGRLTAGDLVAIDQLLE